MDPSVMEITVFCVKVGDRYPVEYVHRLRAMFERRLQIPFTFVCCSDREEDVFPQTGRNRAWWTNPRFPLWGWWNLMEAYSSPWWSRGGAVLYVGLDTVITGDISQEIGGRLMANRLTLLDDFNCLLPESEQTGLFAGTWADGIAFIPRRGVMDLWHAFEAEHKESGIGNTEFPMHVWVTRKLRELGITPDIWQNEHPDLVCSYKWPTRKLTQPPEPVVCFHGEPRPAEAVAEAPWISEHWRE